MATARHSLRLNRPARGSNVHVTRKMSRLSDSPLRGSAHDWPTRGQRRCSRSPPLRMATGMRQSHTRSDFRILMGGECVVRFGFKDSVSLRNMQPSDMERNVRGRLPPKCTLEGRFAGSQGRLTLPSIPPDHSLYSVLVRPPFRPRAERRASGHELYSLIIRATGKVLSLWYESDKLPLLQALQAVAALCQVLLGV